MDKSFIVDIIYPQKTFKNALFNLRLAPDILNQVYQESVRQIFDYMSSDLGEFINFIKEGPNLNGYINVTVMDSTSDIIKPAWIQLSLDIWFHLNAVGIIFDADSTLILDYIDDYVLIIKRYKEPHRDSAISDWV